MAIMRLEGVRREVGDFVILRSTGVPTYNFACAVDDSEMITRLVLRFVRSVQAVQHANDDPDEDPNEPIDRPLVDLELHLRVLRDLAGLIAGRVT